MSNIVEVKNELMSVSNQDVQALRTHIEAIKSFVSDQLKEGLENDYAIIPGTKKRALLKPGAEKLMKLFGFSSSIACIEKTISPEENFAMFTYKATITHIKSGVVVAECEGICNNFEDKYREKAKYENNKKVGMETVNVMNILNTLMKMAQKRALVGAVIIATAASDYFTQDEDEITYQKKQKNAPVDDSKFKDVTPSDLGSYVVPVGKHKGKTFAEIGGKDLENYINWVSKQPGTPTGPMLEVVNKGREFLRGA